MSFKFPVRTPDFVAEEIATVLSTRRTMEFKDLFNLVHVNLRSKDLARGGEEMLRLRSYEKLQELVNGGYATKDGKNYKGIPKMLKEFFKLASEHNARLAAGTTFRPGVKPKVSETTVAKSKIKIAKLSVKKAKPEKRKAVQTR